MKGIIGAIAGDIIGSPYESNRIKTKDFRLFSNYSGFTDDTVLTLAIANWLVEDKTSKDVLIRNLKSFANKYSHAGYGRSFIHWMKSENPDPYGSWSNGSAMRVSPCAWVAESFEEAHELAYASAAVTHNHPDGVNGAIATCEAIYLARVGASKDEIKEHIEVRYDYDLSRRLDEIRPVYSFELKCSKSVPEAIICFLEADDYEDTVRNAVSLGGDADTQAAIAGSIASAYYDVPERISREAINRLDNNLLNVFNRFEEKYMKI
ncbi:ADP-ribosylglycohydrolase family protein [Methanobrevibacter sp.]|uniref:ADP-ribosylglycohydrolase family protein n=1 Tax=Methanobrevibacter sp. TaxID=66852 RepID=UPI0038903C16